MPAKKNRFTISFLLLFLISTGAVAGGVTGGGGGTVPANPASKQDVENAVEHARYQLYLSFSYDSFGNQPSQVDSLLPKLFGGSRSILDVIKTALIHQELSSPCLDPQGMSTDGAAPGPVPDSICISVQNLSEKLTQDNVRAQTLALIAHEFSHLLGTTELEANALQLFVLKKLSIVSEYDLQDQLREISRFDDSGLSVLQVLTNLTDPKALQTQRICQQMTTALDNLNEAKLLSRRSALPFRLHSKAEFSTLEATRLKLLALKYYSCGWDFNIERLFQDASEVNLPEAETNLGPQFGAIPGLVNPSGFTLRRITDTSTASLELEETIRMLKGIESLKYSIQSL